MKKPYYAQEIKFGNNLIIYGLLKNKKQRGEDVPNGTPKTKTVFPIKVKSGDKLWLICQKY